MITGCAKPAEKAPEAGSGNAATKPATKAAIEVVPASAPTKPFRRKHDDRREPVIAHAPPLKLQVIAGGTQVIWEQAAFDATARYTKGTDGEARDVWSLRELVQHNVSPAARVISVTGEDGSKTIDAAAWADAAKTPILHTTRRGTLKFRWADADGRWSESEVKDVTRIELAP